jgi:hypothetical protein
MYKELSSLPFCVTRRGKPAFNVTTIDGFHVTTSPHKPDVTTSIDTPEEVKEVIHKREPELKLCEHGSMRGLCKVEKCNRGILL